MRGEGLLRLVGFGPALAACLILASVILLSPWPAHVPGITIRSILDVDVDVDFQLAMPAMFLQGLPFDPRGIFTYGLASRWLDPSLAAFAIGATAVVMTLSATSLAIIVSDMRTRWVRALAVAVLAAVVFVGWTSVCYLAVPVFAFVQLGLRNGHGFRRALLAALLVPGSAIVALIKFNYFLVAALAFSLLVVIDLTERRIPLAGLAYGCCLIIAWWLAGQHLSDFPLWFRSCLDLATGYADAMARDFDAYSATSEVLFYVACVLPALLVASPAGEVGDGPVRRIAFFILLGSVMFMSTRHAFGGNQLEQAGSVVIFASILAAWYFRSREDRSSTVTANESGAAKFGAARAAWISLSCAALALAVMFAHNLFFRVFRKSCG